MKDIVDARLQEDEMLELEYQRNLQHQDALFKEAEVALSSIASEKELKAKQFNGVCRTKYQRRLNETLKEFEKGDVLEDAQRAAERKRDDEDRRKAFEDWKRGRPRSDRL